MPLRNRIMVWPCVVFHQWIVLKSDNYSRRGSCTRRTGKAQILLVFVNLNIVWVEQPTLLVTSNIYNARYLYVRRKGYEIALGNRSVVIHFVYPVVSKSVNNEVLKYFARFCWLRSVTHKAVLEVFLIHSGEFRRWQGVLCPPYTIKLFIKCSEYDDSGHSA
jgi:hypothetical protein